MSRFKFIFLLFFALGLFAEESEPASPFAPSRETIAPRYSKEPIVEEIKGVLLIPNQDYVGYCNTQSICGLEVHDICVPGGLKALREILEPLFMGQTLTQELLTCIKEKIVLYYRAHDRPVVA
ncbi:MAG: hypothetical protein K940chlam6_01683, partial [Chlamydiae bacterium]|nr:hypothetical protein [Chlamydiota bacterium]